MHDYNEDINDWNNEDRKKYLEAKNINKKLFVESIDLYINDEKIKFDYKYKIKDEKEIKVKFKFKKILNNISFMFLNCSSLQSINLSSFNTNNVIKMRYMFYECSSLKSIDLSSFNTNNVTNMSEKFYECSSLKSID